MPKFLISETIHSEKVKTVRLGTDTITNSPGYTDAEAGKAVKLVGESRYALCAAGDLIEGFISSVNGGKYDDYTIGGIVSTGTKNAICDGSQAAGTGSLAIGDFVVTGTVDAKGTALTTSALKVRKATIQPGITEAAAIGDVNDHINASKFMWRVVSLGNAGAVGDTCVIERI